MTSYWKFLSLRGESRSNLSFDRLKSTLLRFCQAMPDLPLLSSSPHRGRGKNFDMRVLARISEIRVRGNKKLSLTAPHSNPLSWIFFALTEYRLSARCACRLFLFAYRTNSLCSCRPSENSLLIRRGRADCHALLLGLFGCVLFVFLNTKS